MPPTANKKGGGGNKRRKGKKGGHGGDAKERELQFAEDGQTYARIERAMGSGRFEAHCFDGTKRMVHVRGTMHKRVWVNRDDIVLIGIRDFQQDKGDIILKYNADEAQKLMDYGELPSGSIKRRNNTGQEGSDNDDDEGGVVFTHEAQDEEEEDGDEEEEEVKEIDLEDL